MKSKKVVKVFESIYDILYLVIALCMSMYFITTNEKNTLYGFYGMMGLLIVFGDCFHLIPRIISFKHEKAELIEFALGVGKCIAYISMTLYYLLLIYFYKGYYDKELSIPITIFTWFLVMIRFIFCMYPMNQWTTTEINMNTNILRNIPDILIGSIAMMLYFNVERVTNTSFSFMWVAILLTMLFHFPTVILSKKYPRFDMLIIPKTIMYLWILCMGIDM